MNTTHEIRSSTVKMYVTDPYVGDRVSLTNDFVEKNSLKYLKLIQKIPHVLEPWFGDLGRKFASEYDNTFEKMYTVSWFGKHLEKIYHGKELLNLVPNNWEDEYDFIYACKKFSDA